VRIFQFQHRLVMSQRNAEYGMFYGRICTRCTTADTGATCYMYTGLLRLLSLTNSVLYSKACTHMNTGWRRYHWPAGFANHCNPFMVMQANGYYGAQRHHSREFGQSGQPLTYVRAQYSSAQPWFLLDQVLSYSKTRQYDIVTPGGYTNVYYS
jgi:hypothetical protein